MINYEIDDEQVESEAGQTYESCCLSSHGLDQRSYSADYLDGYHSAYRDAWIKGLPWYMKDRFGWPIEFVNSWGPLARLLRILVINLKKIF